MLSIFNYLLNGIPGLRSLLNGVNKQLWSYGVITVVCATRYDVSGFWIQSATGRSLKRQCESGLVNLRLSSSNTGALAETYNAAIHAAQDDEVLIFVHDDVWFDDSAWAQKVRDALRKFDVVGVAGNRRRVAYQPAWVFTHWDGGQKFDIDGAHLSGTVSHGSSPYGMPSYFGPAPARCKLLDGVFIAAAARTLKRNRVTFDPQFAFHYYDLDFCRSATRAGLALGTWPIELTHQSGGSFGSASWQHLQSKYFEKWGR